jgi:hypothetical protein
MSEKKQNNNENSKVFNKSNSFLNDDVSEPIRAFYAEVFFVGIL